MTLFGQQVARGETGQDSPALPPVKIIQKTPKAQKPRRGEAKRAPNAPAPKEGVSTPASPSREAAPGDVIYSANRTATEADKVGSSVDVIKAKDIESQSRTYAKDYLDSLPGVNFSQGGPSGSLATISVRGAYAPYIKVQVDGIDISDPTAPQIATAFQHMLAGDIERIELLKGSQSTLYGGDAVGGVLAIETKRAATPGLSQSGGAEYGAYNTWRGVYTAAYGAENGDVSFTAQGVKSDGFPGADEKNGNRVDDDYRNLAVSGRGEYRLSETVKVFFAVRSFQADIRYPDYLWPIGPVDDKLGNRERTNQEAGRVGTEISLLNGAFVNTFAIQGLENERRDVGTYAGFFNGDRVKAEYQGVMKLGSAVSVLVGADWEEDGAKTSDNPTRLSTELAGAFAQAMVEPLKGLALTAGARLDDHSTFGEFDTYRLTAAYKIADTGARLHASLGTGFRVPSLYELYAPYYGNAALQPEESKSWDAGVEQKLWGGRASADVTYFQLDTSNLINFDWNTFKYGNLPGVIHREGVEVSGKSQLTGELGLIAAYTYVDARQTDGSRLFRVPRNTLALGLDALLFDKVKANVTAKLVLDTVDINPFGASTPLQDYLLLNAKLAYDIKPGVTAYIRGENLLDRRYETILGYGTPGLSVYGGLAFKFAQ